MSRYDPTVPNLSPRSTLEALRARRKNPSSPALARGGSDSMSDLMAYGQQLESADGAPMLPESRRARTIAPRRPRASPPSPPHTHNYPPRTHPRPTQRQRRRRRRRVCPGCRCIRRRRWRVTLAAASVALHARSYGAPHHRPLHRDGRPARLRCRRAALHSLRPRAAPAACCGTFSRPARSRRRRHGAPPRARPPRLRGAHRPLAARLHSAPTPHTHRPGHLRPVAPIDPPISGPSPLSILPSPGIARAHVASLPRLPALAPLCGRRRTTRSST